MTVLRPFRAARNEDLFRRLNERLHVLSEHAHRAPVATATGESPERFVCECARTDCSVVVELTPDEYAAVRSEGARFFVYPDPSHTAPELEEIVDRRDRYWVVQKKGKAGLEAEALVDRPAEPL